MLVSIIHYFLPYVLGPATSVMAIFLPLLEHKKFGNFFQSAQKFLKTSMITTLR